MCVRIELNGITHDVEIRTGDRGAFFRSKNARFQVEHRLAHFDGEVGAIFQCVSGDFQNMKSNVLLIDASSAHRFESASQMTLEIKVGKHKTFRFVAD